MPKRRLTKPTRFPLKDVLSSCTDLTTSHLVDPDVPRKKPRKPKK